MEDPFREDHAQPRKFSGIVLDDPRVLVDELCDGDGDGGARQGGGVGRGSGGDEGVPLRVGGEGEDYGADGGGWGCDGDFCLDFGHFSSCVEGEWKGSLGR